MDHTPRARWSKHRERRFARRHEFVRQRPFDMRTDRGWQPASSTDLPHKRRWKRVLFPAVIHDSTSASRRETWIDRTRSSRTSRRPPSSTMNAARRSCSLAGRQCVPAAPIDGTGETVPLTAGWPPLRTLTRTSSTAPPPPPALPVETVGAPPIVGAAATAPPAPPPPDSATFVPPAAAVADAVASSPGWPEAPWAPRFPRSPPPPPPPPPPLAAITPTTVT